MRTGIRALRRARAAVLTFVLLCWAMTGSAGDVAALTRTLSNGIVLHTVNSASAAGVSIRVLVPVGSRDDPRGMEGLAHYVEHLLAADLGPLARTTEEQSELRLSEHGDGNAWTSSRVTVYVQNVAQSRLEQALELLAERLTRLRDNPALAEREQRIVKQEYLMSRGLAPIAKASNELFLKLGMRDAGLGSNIGVPLSIEKFDATAAKAFFDAHYVPEGMVLVISGSIDASVVVAMAERTLGKIPTRRGAGAGKANSPSAKIEPVLYRTTDTNATAPTVVRYSLIRLSDKSVEERLKAYAAISILPRILSGYPGGPEPTLGLHKARVPKSAGWRTVGLSALAISSDWAYLVSTSTLAPNAPPNAHLPFISARVAAFSEKDVPAKLLEEVHRNGDSAWREVEDAGSADAVISWLRLGFSLSDRPAYADALKSLSARDVVAVVRRFAKPDTTATAYINPAN